MRKISGPEGRAQRWWFVNDDGTFTQVTWPFVRANPADLLQSTKLCLVLATGERIQVVPWPKGAPSPKVSGKSRRTTAA